MLHACISPSSEHPYVRLCPLLALDNSAPRRTEEVPVMRIRARDVIPRVLALGRVHLELRVVLVGEVRAVLLDDHEAFLAQGEP